MNKVVELSNREVENLLPFSCKITIAGSIRRRVSNPKDIDIVLIPKSELDKDNIFKYTSQYEEGSIGNGVKLASYKKEGIQIQIYFASKDNIGAMLLFATGSCGYNIGLRNVAWYQFGYTLNRYGLLEGKKLIASKTEEDIYRALNKSYKSPELRGLSHREMREIWGVSSNTRILPEGVNRLK